MIKFFIGMIIGLIVGVIIGVVAMSFCFIVKTNDEYSKRYMKDKEREQE